MAPAVLLPSRKRRVGGEYNGIGTSTSLSTNWYWNNTTYDQDIYTHVFDQNGPSGGDGTPYRYLSATNLGNNVCSGDTETTSGKTYSTYITDQKSCTPDTLNAGNWYNYPAATAGSDNYASYTTSQNSICPKGWRLPPNDDKEKKSYNNLIHNAYHIADGPSGSVDSNLLANSAMSFVRLGCYYYDYGSLANRGYVGHYWSSTAYSATNSHDLDFHSELLNPQNRSNRAHGFSVRCVSRDSR